jgi:hypothetical protein
VREIWFCYAAMNVFINAIRYDERKLTRKFELSDVINKHQLNYTVQRLTYLIHAAESFLGR